MATLTPPPQRTNESISNKKKKEKKKDEKLKERWLYIKIRKILSTDPTRKISSDKKQGSELI